MLFNSPEFLFLFLPLTLGAFALVNRGDGRWTAPLLGVTSLVFYATLNRPGFRGGWLV